MSIQWTDKDRANPIDAAAGHLPDGWSVYLSVERHGRSVALTNPEGDYVPFPTNYENWQEEVLDAVEYAVEQNKETT